MPQTTSETTDAPPTHGTYILHLHLDTRTTIQVGKHDTITFKPGTYYYVGSALGPGGFKRVERHKDQANNPSNPHWHIDYLLPHMTITTVTKIPANVECRVADAMTGHPVAGFGATDCSCTTHLYHHPSTH